MQFFPPFSPPLAPYLASADQFGNTALKPGTLFPWAPNDVLPKRLKYWAAEVGLRYSLQQTVTHVNMTDVMQGDNTLAYYTLAIAAAQVGTGFAIRGPLEQLDLAPQTLGVWPAGRPGVGGTDQRPIS